MIDSIEPIERYRAILGIGISLATYEKGILTILNKGNGVQTHFQSFQGLHENALRMYQVKKEVCFGEAMLYEDDIIRLKWSFHQGKKSGDFLIFEDGMASIRACGTTKNSGATNPSLRTPSWVACFSCLIPKHRNPCSVGSSIPFPKSDTGGGIHRIESKAVLSSAVTIRRMLLCTRRRSSKKEASCQSTHSMQSSHSSLRVYNRLYIVEGIWIALRE